MKLGDAIRHYRKEKGLTLKELSDLCGLSVAQISKLETGKSQASMAGLAKLSNALGVHMSVFTMTDEIDLPDPVRAGEGFTIRLNTGSEKRILLRYLTVRRDVKMQPIIVTLPAGTDSRIANAHPGEEFCYILSGHVKFFYGEESVYDMKAGDFIYYEARISHRWKNVGDVEATILTCNTPPIM